MRRLLTALTMFVALLGLGALAVLARAGSGIVTPGANTAFRAPNAADPATSALSAPNAINKYNNIVLPLDIEADWASGGIAFTAKGLAQYIGASSVIQVLRWTPASQSYDMWFPAGNYGFVNGVYTTTPFSLATGGVYRLLINSTNPSLTSVSFVGNVPPANSIKYTLSGATSCRYNDLALSLEQSVIIDAEALATSMGGSANVSQVLRWDEIRQSYDMWFPSGAYGFVSGVYTTTPFAVRIGYPYRVCLKAGASSLIWPEQRSNEAIFSMSDGQF